MLDISTLIQNVIDGVESPFVAFMVLTENKALKGTEIEIVKSAIIAELPINGSSADFEYKGKQFTITNWGGSPQITSKKTGHA